MKRKVFIYVCGILTFPGVARNWTGRAVTWTHLHTPSKAEKIEYFVGPISRVLGQGFRAGKLLSTLEFYTGWQIHLIGHSNGCDVILDALAAAENRGGGFPRIHSLHLISAACSADFEHVRLNEFVADRKIRHLHVWIAGKDNALALADTFTGRALGYGALGRSGPLNNRVPFEQIHRPAFGHSDWFSEENFDATMQILTAPL